MKDKSSLMRRQYDLPILILSQDYELFFHVSGSVEKCLLEPGELLMSYAKNSGVKITFFVDAGMLCRMGELAPKNVKVAKDLGRINKQISRFAAEGHEIGLHIHPHWEDTRISQGQWDFSGSRYRIDQFSDVEAAEIVARYSHTLKNLCDGAVRSYRAGGFCVEPFDKIRDALLDEDITTDSSVVPGALLKDPEKGFDFRSVKPDKWWNFDRSPLECDPGGRFTEIPVTPSTLPIFHYWGRLVDRLRKRQVGTAFGDGISKAIGKREVLRRLAGTGRVSELSIDSAKVEQLLSHSRTGRTNGVWHVMGHPKLLGLPSLSRLDEFIQWQGVRHFETLSSLSQAIRGDNLSER